MAIDSNYFRPTEVELLIGNPAKANQKLGWKPKYDLDMLVKEMIQADLDIFRRDKLLTDSGYKVNSIDQK